MRSFAAFIMPAALVLLATACGGPNDTLSPAKLPGFEIALPPWSEQVRGDRWMSDRVALADERNERMFFVQWQPAAALWTTAELDGALAAARAAFPAMSITGKPTPLTISGHDGLEVPLGVEHIEGRVATWFCPEHKRQVMLMTLAPRTVHDAIVASVRCHTSAPPAGEDKALFPKFDPPPGMTRQEDDGDPSTQSWASDTAVMVFMAGSPGETMTEVSAAGMRTTVRKMVELGGLTDVGDVSDARATGQDGVERRIYTTRASVEGSPMDVRVAMWFCAEVNRTFMAMHMSAPNALEPFTVEQHVLRATCP